MQPIERLIVEAPKVELHLHLEGTLEPELMFALAERNSITLRFANLDDVRNAYEFTSLQSFLDIYYQATAVLREPEDFEELTWNYLERVAAEGVRHVEAFFDPQSHTARGVRFDDVVDGIAAALKRAETELGMSSMLIACFLRHLGADSAQHTLTHVLSRDDVIEGVGLDSSELGFPPGPYAGVFRRAKASGLRAVAHAGEEGPATNIEDSLDLLGVERIDHGVRCLDDPRLVERLVRERVPLTVCPLSNIALKVVPNLTTHPLRHMLQEGLMVTVNSDDPAYFGGYLTENLLRAADSLALTTDDIGILLRNGIEASFASEARKKQLLEELTSAIADQRRVVDSAPSA